MNVPLLRKIQEAITAEPGHFAMRLLRQPQPLRHDGVYRRVGRGAAHRACPGRAGRAEDPWCRAACGRSPGPAALQRRRCFTSAAGRNRSSSTTGWPKPGPKRPLPPSGASRHSSKVRHFRGFLTPKTRKCLASGSKRDTFPRIYTGLRGSNPTCLTLDVNKSRHNHNAVNYL